MLIICYLVVDIKQMAGAMPGAVNVVAADLARIFDPLRKGSAGPERVIDRREGAAIVEDPVMEVDTVDVVADNTAGFVDGLGECAVRPQRIVNRRKGAAVVEEAVGKAGTVDIVTDDAPRIIDPQGKGRFT